MEDTRVFYAPGDIVTIKHEELENRPIMMVKEKVETTMKDKEGCLTTTFVGIRTIWFDKNQDLQSAVFSTKDLMHI